MKMYQKNVLPLILDDKSDLMIRLPDGGRKQWTVSCHSKVKVNMGAF